MIVTALYHSRYTQINNAAAAVIATVLYKRAITAGTREVLREAVPYMNRDVLDLYRDLVREIAAGRVTQIDSQEQTITINADMDAPTPYPVSVPVS